MKSDGKLFTGAMYNSEASAKYHVTELSIQMDNPGEVSRYNIGDWFYMHPGAKIMKTDQEKRAAAPIRPDPWWAYLVYAGSGVLGRVLAGGLSSNGKEKRRLSRGVKISQPGRLDSGIDPARISASSIIGERIKGSDGKELGKIEEIVFDITSGGISYFVLSAGGVLGLGDKFYAIPLDSLTFSPEERIFSLPIDKKVLKKMPDFDKHNWPPKALQL